MMMLLLYLCEESNGDRSRTVYVVAMLARITKWKASVLVLHLVEAELCWLDMVCCMREILAAW